MVELAQSESGLGFGGTPSRVDADALHGREVEHQSPVAYRLARDAVAPATDREQQIVGPGELYPLHYVGHPRAAHDKRWATVHHAVEDGACPIVAVMSGTYELSPQAD
jgi:hypothetical protein